MCCDSGSVRNRNKPGYMRGTPRILRYMRASRVCKNPQGRPIRRSKPSETARRAPTRESDDDTVHAPWRHGEHVNKVSVGEPADGSPPKERHKQFGGLGKVERASASRSRTSNPLLFGLQISLSVRPSRRWVQYQRSHKKTK